MIDLSNYGLQELGVIGALENYLKEGNAITDVMSLRDSDIRHIGIVFPPYDSEYIRPDDDFIAYFEDALVFNGLTYEIHYPAF